MRVDVFIILLIVLLHRTMLVTNKHLLLTLTADLRDDTRKLLYSVFSLSSSWLRSPADSKYIQDCLCVYEALCLLIAVEDHISSSSQFCDTLPLLMISSSCAKCACFSNPVAVCCRLKLIISSSLLRQLYLVIELPSKVWVSSTVCRFQWISTRFVYLNRGCYWPSNPTPWLLVCPFNRDQQTIVWTRKPIYR